MSARKVSRGHPLVALLAILGGWIGGRVATWHSPVMEAFSAEAAASTGLAQVGMPVPGVVPAAMPLGLQSMPGGGQFIAYPTAGGAYATNLYPGAPAVRYVVVMPPRGADGLPAALDRGPSASSLLPHLRAGFAAIEPGQHFFAPDPPGAGAAAVLPQPAGEATPPSRRRWSMDAWALLRQDGDGLPTSAGAMPGTYGASQAGAVTRYRLGLESRYRPTAYLRTSSSMGVLRETAAALGISARPIPAVPVIAALEGRLIDQAGLRRVQGAAMAITELPPFALPAGFRGETYAQAGYVAGQFSTAFVDGQVRADRPLFDLSKVQGRIGGGVWGGAQKGAARLDAGPSATVTLPLGRGVNGRVAVDWRFRVAGEAVPDSGPAVTLSAGF